MFRSYPNDTTGNTSVQLLWSDLCNVTCEGSLTFLSVNARSIVNKFPEFLAHLSLSKIKYTFILVVESWLNESNDKGFDIDGYKCVTYYRPNRRGGGLKLYYLGNIQVDICDEYTGGDDIHESIFLKTKIPNYGKLNVVGIYRIPSRPLNEFLDIFSQTLDRVCLGKSVIMGDFNVDTLKGNLFSQDYNYVFNSYGFRNIINSYTYVSPISGDDTSCLDHLWHNLDVDVDSFVLVPSISDHYAILGIFKIILIEKNIKIRFRDFSLDNKDVFLNSMYDEFAMCQPPIDDVNACSEYITCFLKRLLNKYFSVKTKISNCKKLNTPWINKKILRCIRKKHKWFKMLRKNKITRSSYKRYQVALRYLLRVAEQEYYKDRLKLMGPDSRRNWRTLNKLLGKKEGIISEKFIIDDIECSDPVKIANEFNKYFIEYPKLLHDSIPNSVNDYSYLIPFNDHSMFMYYCTEHEMVDAITSLRKEGGLADISCRFLKLCKYHIAPYLCNLFNLCIDKSIYPSEYKHSKITPLFKKGSRVIFKNHRPISILCNLNKLFESLLHERFRNFFNKYGLLSANQFGFRKHKNTELACFNLITKILPVFEIGSFCICVFIDYSACFDTIDREKLFSKLYRYGIRGSVLKLVKSYFCDRKQSVLYANVQSSEMNQSLGTIQGSKNGPLFFDVYSSDLNMLVNDDSLVMFADDTAIVYVHHDLDILVDHVNEKLKIIYDWCNFNKMLMNPDKCEYMLFTNRKVVDDPHIYIGNSRVKRVNSVKYLGVHIDDGLKFNTHIDYLKGRLAQYCGITYRLSNYFSLQTAKTFYFSFIYSLISYCMCIWGGVFHTSRRAENIRKLHNRIVKNLFLKYFVDSNDIYKNIDILRIDDLFKWRCSVYMFKILKYNMYPTLQECLNLLTLNHGHNTRNINNFMLPYPRVNCIRTSFKYQFVSIFNDIDDELKNSSNTKIFKSLYKTFILNSY